MSNCVVEVVLRSLQNLGLFHGIVLLGIKNDLKKPSTTIVNALNPNQNLTDFLRKGQGNPYNSPAGTVAL